MKPIFDFFSGEMRAALLPSPSFSVKGLTLQEGLTPGGQRKRTELIGSECKGKWYCFCCGDLVFACIRRVETLFDKIGCLFFSQFCTTIAAQSYIISDLYSRKNHTVLSLLSLFIPTSRMHRAFELSNQIHPRFRTFQLSFQRATDTIS